MKISQNAKNAIMLGTLCSIAYFAVYIARNILSAVTPAMIEGGLFTEASIGTMSSLYFVTYAVGQLINGMIGDRIKAKYMITCGLILAGVTNFLFPLVAEYSLGTTVIYGMTGFFLSMIYAPMTKIVSENTEPIHAVRCSLGYTFASFFGSPAAGLLAAMLVWHSVFTVSSIILFVMGAVCITCFTLYEKKGIITYGKYKPKEKGVGNIKILFKHEIVKYSLVSVLTGIVRTSVVFWLPTYIAQYLNFPPEKAAMIFTVATLVISLTAFISQFIYECLGRQRNKTVLLMFITSSVFFLLTYLVHIPFLNIVCIVIAIMASNGAANMLWSVYCPSLRDTGMVSSATGFLDFLSYMAAATANLVFANAVSAIGWGNLILVWSGVVSLGVIIMLPYRAILDKKRKKSIIE